MNNKFYIIILFLIIQGISCQQQQQQVFPQRTKLQIVEPLSYPTIGGKIVLEDKKHFFELSLNPGNPEILQLMTPSDYNLENISIDLSHVGVISLMGPGPKDEPVVPDWLTQVNSAFAIRLYKSQLKHYMPWMRSMKENNITTLMLYMCDVKPEQLIELTEMLNIKEILVSAESISSNEKKLLEASQLFNIEDKTIPEFYRPDNIW